MHHRHRYAGTAVMLLMAAAVLFTGSTYAQKAVEGEGKKKKLYISTIKANGWTRGLPPGLVRGYAWPSSRSSRALPGDRRRRHKGDVPAG